MTAQVSESSENSVEILCAPPLQPKRLFIFGKNNRVLVEPGCDLSELDIHIEGEDNFFRLSADCKLKGRIFMKGKRLKVKVGRNTTIEGVYIHCAERSSVTIGKDCMFSYDVELRTSDAHSLIDVTTSKRINPPGDIRISDGVWIGARAIISKGVELPPNTMVGAMSFVNKSFSEPNTIIAGVPAKIIRRGVVWDRSRRYEYTAEEMSQKLQRSKKWISERGSSI
jgi:acetyltransferase-like isoleucine patch superfamily enzyme